MVLLSILTLVLMLPAAALASHSSEADAGDGNEEHTNQGRSDEAPGQDEQPGNSEGAPGQDEEAPNQDEERGNSEDAPGQNQERGNSDEAPGQNQERGDSDEAPGQNQERGADEGNEVRASQSQGNRGFIQVSSDDEPFPPNNEPHQDCDFFLNFYNYPEAVEGAAVTFFVQPPASPSGVTVDASPQWVPFGEQTGGNGVVLNASQYYDFTDLLDGIEPHHQHGYHIKVTVDRDGMPGSRPQDQKQHVFWVDCQLEDEVSDTVALSVTKVARGDTDTTLQGAEFELFQDDGDGVFDAGVDEQVGAACTTDASGVCVFAELDPDTTYFLVETDAPDGYEVIGTGVRTVVMGGDDRSVTIQNVPTGGGDTVALTVTKVSTADATTTLPGAVFELFQDDGDGVFDDGVDEQVGAACTTDASGVCVFADLDPDTTYFLQEISAPQGYEVIGDGVSVIAVGDTDTSRRVANAPTGGILGTVALTVTKVSSVDATTVLQGAVFELYRDEGDPGFGAEQDTLFGTCTTDADGECGFTGLSPDTDFLLVETSAPADFEIIGDGVTAVTTTDEDARVRVLNAPVDVVENIERDRPDSNVPGRSPQQPGVGGPGEGVEGGAEADEVAGVAIERDRGQAAPRSQVARGDLPRTGTDGRLLLALAIGLLTAGMLLRLQAGGRPATEGRGRANL